MGLRINTAAVVVGSMGSDQRFDCACLRNGGNLVARLEGQTKPYGVKLVVKPLAVELVRNVYKAVEVI
jgi:adenylate cyclase